MPEDRLNPLEQLELELTHLRARLKEVEKDLSACREAAFALGERLSAAQERPAVPEGLPVPPAVAPPPPTPSQAQATSDFRAGAVSTPQPEPPSSAQRRLQAFFQSGAPAAPPGPPPWHVAREWLFKIIGRPPEGENIEMLLGIYWLVRLGVLALAIALGMWGVYLSQGSGPVQRVLLGYALSAVLLAAGWYYRRHVELFGRSLIAGGLAIGFFVSFAAHFLPAMNCLPVPASALLSAAFVAAMLAISERWQAPVIAGMSIFIGQAAAYVATREVGAEPLLAMLILAAAALYLQLRRGWTHLSLFALASSYLTLAPWLFTHPGREHNDFHFWLNLTCLTTIYGVFICAQLLFLLRRGEAQKSFLETALGVTVGVVNALFYFVFTSFLYLMTDRVEVLFGFYFPLAAVQVGVGMLERRRDSGADAFYFALAVVLALLGTFSAWDGLARNAILYAFALLLLIAGYRLRMAVFYYAAEGVLAVAVLDFLHYHAVRPFAPNDYWGGLFGAAVLFTKSMLEERQPPPAHWGREWMEFMRRANQVLTWTHAGLAVVLCAWLSHARWDGRAEMIALAILSLVILLAGLSLRTRPAFWAAAALTVWGHVAFVASLPASWPGPSEAVPSWSWAWLAGATLLSAGLLTPRTLRHAWATLERSQPVYWTLVALAALTLSATALVHVTRADSLSLLRCAPILVAGLFLPALAWEYQRMTREARDPIEPLHGALARTLAALGGWIVPLALTTTLARPHALLASTLCALLLGGGTVLLRPMAYASGVALLVALGQYYHGLGAFAAARDWPMTSLFLFIVGVILTALTDRAQRDRPAWWWILPALAVYGIVYALLHQRVHPMALYPGVALAAGLLLWGARAAAAPRLAAATLPLLALAHAAFYFYSRDGVGRPLGHGFTDLILPMLATGLLTAAYERTATGGWKLPGLPPLAEEWRRVVAPLRHLLILAMILVGMSTTAHSDLLAPELSAVGWSATAVILLLWGFAFRAGIYRRYGLALFLFVIARIALFDTRELDLPAKIIVWAVLGGCLIGVGVLYVQFREKLMKWLG